MRIALPPTSGGHSEVRAESLSAGWNRQMFLQAQSDVSQYAIGFGVRTLAHVKDTRASPVEPGLQCAPVPGLP